ncbi:hypothetical protein ISF_06867 [Cordyceps fumosorosea ARSEF 2679]|uniref:DUF300 domain protein n=1 Tax=Cordyceps fumosorosea (strain ARSEF 2679) TaxID=1081104 RepID=A0A167R6Y1_CORFA|nr:hypothetical protein ISF_06867 [Cordyceps fumosorosea ARSEF 2679]OAA58328.1 hypothetical protein ISF_06867 [Cordyceps fumosorosea ARSEF 2679]
MNLTCNNTLEHLRIEPGDEIEIVGHLTFHELARIIGAACTLIAVMLSVYLAWMHALHYTKPREQRYIIRILFMVPVYAISSFLQIQWYRHAIYFQVISDCYEAFAIASFFALLCHYVAPDLHSQKEFFRNMRPVKPWVMPVNWFAACCGGQRGPWRTPKSGLTWFNINWIGVYQYCFVRVAMTVSAVVSQYFEKYCESSNSPIFAHIWIIVLNALAVTVAMFCLIQVYVQLKEPLKEQKLLIKIVAIKLVVFLSFWQASAISVGTSTLHIVHANKVLAYPDIKVGIPALLLCVEMAVFALLHLWAFPYKPYTQYGATPRYYPNPDLQKGDNRALPNELEGSQGGFLGFAALWDAMNVWDFIKAFGRGMRWLFCGIRRRKEDISYRRQDAHDMDNLDEHKGKDSSYDAYRPGTTMEEPPVGGENPYVGKAPVRPTREGDLGVAVTSGEESAGLMQHAQTNPRSRPFGSGSDDSRSNSPPRTQVHEPYLQPYEARYNNSPRPQEQHPSAQRPSGQPPAAWPQDPYASQQQYHQAEEHGVIGQAMWQPPPQGR